MKPGRFVVAALLCAAVSGCAWSNPANRPVWNTFEQEFVPDDGPAFYATLPLTVPFGVAAIVVDVFAAHPLQVVDDAWGNAADIWIRHDVDYEQQYYTELASTIPRGVFTPVVFGLSFVGRCLFDIPPRRTDAEQREFEQRRDQAQHAARLAGMLRWLESGCRQRLAIGPRFTWDDRLEEPMRRALSGDAEQRVGLHRGMLQNELLAFGPYRATAGLEDVDPVVRWATLAAWPEMPRPSRELLEALSQDPVESVRLLARRRFPTR